jgi:hypothetical protein
MKKMKRSSWTEMFLDNDPDVMFQKENLFYLDDALYDLWALGKNIILAWTLSANGINVIVVPHYTIGEAIAQNRHAGNQRSSARGNQEIRQVIQKVVSGSKRVSNKDLSRISDLLRCKPQQLKLPFQPGEDLPLDTMNSLIKRYSITYVEDRAVALFDIVGFSHYAPLEQAMQLNSLGYSVNTAYSKLLEREIKIQFVRSTTGDGFYIWNRNRSLHANVDLYHFMHLVLADNAVARSKTQNKTVPMLRTCFHVGGHYEFYQSEGLNPTTFSYIVGDVTIELARMIEQARPGQILMGSFQLQCDDSQSIQIDTVDFIESAQDRLSSLSSLVLGGDSIESIKCYLTGSRKVDGSYGNDQYLIKDKHGYTRYVYNAKVNIHRKNSEPIFLGIQNSNLSGFGTAPSKTIVEGRCDGTK